MRSHTWEHYCNDRRCAGTFENQILYATCRDNFTHTSPYVIAGKITAIGRIYAASPERGAGKGKNLRVGLSDAIGIQLAQSKLDEKLSLICFEEKFSAKLIDSVAEIHTHLVGEIRDAIFRWSELASDQNWKPRSHRSFASKYLHFHRPNLFPIMDSLARAGLSKLEPKAGWGDYKQFCVAIGEYIDKIPPDWTLRSLDTMLVSIGRGHSGNQSAGCGCNVVHINSSAERPDWLV